MTSEAKRASQRRYAERNRLAYLMYSQILTLAADQAERKRRAAKSAKFISRHKLIYLMYDDLRGYSLEGAALEARRLRSRRSYRANPAPCKARAKQWNAAHPQAVKAKNRAWSRANYARILTRGKERRARLTDGALRQYLSTATGLRAGAIPAELISAKRDHLVIKRAIRDLRSAITTKTKGRP